MVKKALSLEIVLLGGVEWFGSGLYHGKWMDVCMYDS